jgi:hypothetical protein
MKKRHGKMACNVVTILGSLVAAGLWWYASQVNVAPVPGNPNSIAFGNMDLYPTLVAGSYWNKWAAIAAGVAAVAQAAASFFDVIDSAEY